MKASAYFSFGMFMVLITPLASANVHDTFGVGARGIGMGNAQTACAVGGAAAYHNPAGLARTKGIQLDIGFQSFVPKFPDFGGIVYDRNQNGTIDVDERGNPETTSVGTQYAPSTGVGINAAIPIFSWFTVGASVYMPNDYLMRLGFEDAYIPYYALYKNRTQHFSIYMGAGIKVFDGLYIGVGGSSGAVTNIDGKFTANIGVDANTTDANGDPLTVVDVNANIDRMTVAVASGMAVNAGVLFNFGWLGDPLEGLNLGAAYRSSSFVEAKAAMEAMAYGAFSLSDESLYSGPLINEPVSSESTTQSSFNPAQASAGISYSWKDRISVDADVVWTQWSTYQETYISSTTVNSSEGTEVNVQVGRDLAGDPGIVWNDIVSPRIGIEYKGGMPRGRELGFGFAIRGGYGYSPSPIPEQTAKANMLDSDKHIFSGGLGFQIPLSRLPNPLRVDLFASYHKLKPRTHQKDDSLIVDEDGNYPAGYPVGGTIVSQGGVSGFGASAGLTF